MGTAEESPDARARALRDVHCVGSTGGGHRDARGGPRPEGVGALRVGLRELPARLPHRDRRGGTRRRPARADAPLRRRPGAVLGRTSRGRPGPLHVGARRRALPPGSRRGSRSGRRLCRHRPQPARGATGADDGCAVDGVGRTGHRRTGRGGGGRASLRVALGVPRPDPAGRRGRTDRRARAPAARPTGRCAGGRAPGRRCRPHRCRCGHRPRGARVTRRARRARPGRRRRARRPGAAPTVCSRPARCAAPGDYPPPF